MKKNNKKNLLLLVTGLLAVSTIGCLSTGEPENRVTATASEFEWALSKNTAPAGLVEFRVINGGTEPHEFMLYKQSDADAVIAMHRGEGMHGEEAHGHDEDDGGHMMDMGDLVILELDEINFPVGTEMTLSASLEPGVYEIGCHIEDHYEEGMRATLIVS